MLDALVIFGLSVPVIVTGLWLSRRDYHRHGRLTWLGLGGCALALFMPNFLLAWHKPWFTMPEGPVELVGTILWIAGLSLLFVSMGHFRKPAKVMGLDNSRLETGGIYRYSRNPQYVFWVMFIGGYALTGPLGPGLLAVVLLLLVIHGNVLIEEKHLLAVYGEEYERYLESAPRYFLDLTS